MGLIADLDAATRGFEVTGRRPDPTTTSNPLEITVRTWAALARTRVALRGALTEHTRNRLAHALDGLADANDQVILDLSEVNAIDTAGTDAILEHEHRAGARGIALIIENPSPSVRRALACRNDQP